ncbi:MAG TPA: hypothetical protein VLD19_11105, partial [Chitinophagaceae bacterium]|nr:hypothetical protein [Chitinophagaceae bacterium]
MPTPANTNIVSRWLKYNFYTKKFNTTAGIIVMGIIGTAIAYSGAILGPGMPLMIACAIAGILFCIICFRYPLVGFYSSMFFSSLLTMPDRITPVAPPVPLGMCVEALQYLTLLSIIAKQYRLRSDVGPFWRNPLTIMFLVLLAYYISDVFNPVYHSKLGWFNYVRKQFSYFAFYYMAYILMDSYERIRQFIKIWLIMALVIALYGIKQQWFGLTSFELQWYQRNPDLYALSFQSGFLRKPSLLSDPASFGVLCATTLLFTLVMAARTPNRKRRYQYLVASLLLFLGSSYSGTRSCNLMIVAGVMAYGLFTMNEKRTYTIMIAFVLVGAFILFGPFRNNPVVYRISSTFQGNKDASAMVRSVNRHRVQPYLLVHPM